MIQKIKEKIMQDRRIGRSSLEAFLEILKEVKAEYINTSTEHINKLNNWIDVKDRLPDIGERVILWVYGRSQIGKRIDAKLFGYDIFSLESGANESTKRIKAWRPLPEPYKPKEGGQ